ncbi:hypothetical protein ACODNH_06990 [Haloarcula sp. NS06]|uniref:hypothetical protein n=1 Tax=Haloarcula sp. NS06 TaxID=3409688 RepID=UPI003DA6E2B5
MGYSAPSPGDEVEIPRDVCRPLRVLGDLHFKSETPGEVELGGVSKVTKKSVESLSDEQQDMLWSYVDSHAYVGGKAQDLLPRSSNSSSPNKKNAPANKPQKTDYKPSEANPNFPGIIPSKNVHIGQINRFSNNGNAMLEPREGRELNIGSLPRTTEGKMTIGGQYAESLAYCLTPQLWTGSYRHKFQDDLDDLGEYTGLSGLNQLLGIRNKDSPENLSESDVSVYINIIGDGFGIGFQGPWSIVILSDHLKGHQEIRVEIVDDHEDILIARPIPLNEDSEPVGVGGEIKISVDDISGDYIYGTCGPRVVKVQRTSSQPDKSLRAAITETNGERIVASVSALPESSRPTEDEVVTFHKGVLAEYPDIPVITPASLPDIDTHLSLVVVSVETDGVRVEVPKRTTHSTLSIGEELSIKVNTWNGGIGITDYENIPVQIEGGRPLREIPIRTKITEFTKGSVRGKFLRADVSDDSTEDVDTLLERGAEILQLGDHEEAATVFANAVELSLSDNSSQYSRARLHEILAVCECIKDKEGMKSAVDFLNTIEASSDEINEPIKNQIDAYNRILEADCLISDAAKSSDSVTATTHRRDAKHLLTEAAELLIKSETDFDIPAQPVINRILAHAADRLLITPDSVTQYLDSISVNY